jgi:hypothetical protein
MQEEAMSGMQFWSIGSGIIRKGVLLVRSVDYSLAAVNRLVNCKAKKLLVRN